VPRRCRPLRVAGLAALFALAPITSEGQTPPPDPGVDLLRPSVEGNPTNPQRFRGLDDTAQAPFTDRFTAPSRIGATPTYGSPSGFGEGDTGFDSTNTKGRQKPAQALGSDQAGAPGTDTTFDQIPPSTPPAPPKPRAPPPPLPPEIHPAKAAARIGATLPPPPDPLPVSNPPPEIYPAAAARRPGANVPVPPAANFEASATPPSIGFEASASTPPLGTPPLNTLPLGTPTPGLPLAGVDPYEALGIRAGSFLVLPAVEFSTGSDSNPQHVPGGGSSLYFVLAPELHVRSDWSRHALTADITGSYTDYTQAFSPSLNRPYLNSKIDGRVDVTRDTQLILENRVIVTTDNPGSPNITAGLAKLPIDTTVGGTFGVVQQFNRLSLSLKGTLDRAMYNESALTDGETASNADRNFDQYAGIMRVAYELDPGLKPFVEASEDTRVHDEQFDRSGLQRDSNGTSVKVGGDVDLFGSLTGEMAIGYLERTYKDPTLPNISGTTLDGSLLWQATALTSAKLSAASSVAETILPGVSGAFSRDFNIEVDHAFRRWLIGALQAGYGRDEYVGFARDDNRYFAMAGLTYKLNPDIQIKGQVREDWLTSTAPGAAYAATSVLVGVRLQR
jgi:hypothetical protein